MIDREKVIKGLECCIDPNNKCEECPHLGKQTDVLACAGALMEDALELLKADQTYLQKLTERLQNLGDLAIRGTDWRPDDD